MILPAPSQWVLYCHFTDEETEVWGDTMRGQEPPSSPHLPILRAIVQEPCPRQLQHSPSCPWSGRVAFRERLSLEPCTSLSLLPAPGSEPAGDTAHSSAVASWQGQWAIHHLMKPKAAGQAGGQDVAGSSGPQCSVLMVGFQAPSPACERAAGASRAGLSFKPQSLPE